MSIAQAVYWNAHARDQQRERPEVHFVLMTGGGHCDRWVGEQELSGGCWEDLDWRMGLSFGNWLMAVQALVCGPLSSVGWSLVL